ncbi:MAG: AAC(3) family N-acetyltransferase [Povalibacter sp.]
MQFLDAHIDMICHAGCERSLWMPAFNYDFPRTQLFDVKASESQLGPIPERFRTAASTWRTAIPIFSVSGIGYDPQPRWDFGTDPFGPQSIFAELVNQDGVVLYYGDTFHYNTLVHYSERASGGPLYRYDKLFLGRVVMPDGSIVEGSLDYHVRPMNMGLDYDWPRLRNDAECAGVLRHLDGYPEILAASARGLNALWMSNLDKDPFSLLDQPTRSWAEPQVNKLGRRFLISDFETTELQRAEAPRASATQEVQRKT